MKMTMRWFNQNDPVRLQDIAQISVVRGIVGTMDAKAGDSVWEQAEFETLKQEVEAHGLSLDVIESIPIADGIKLGTAERDQLIDNYCESIRNMGRAGIPVLCYNFMPVFDWMRTDLAYQLDDGSFATAYKEQEMLAYDLSKGIETRVAWVSGFTGEELQSLIAQYTDLNEAGLFENFAYFLKRVVPVAEEAGVYLALHPDDPPWSIFNLPRIVRDKDTIQRILDVVDSPHNGLTFCTGSLGSRPDNDLPAMIRQFGSRINFVHLRNVELIGEHSFREVAHPDEAGNVKLPAVMQALVDIDFSGPLRPDHGRMIWGETGRQGYGLYDRALGAMYLHGLWQGIRQERGL